MNQSNSIETLESYDDFENMTFLTFYERNIKHAGV